MKIALIFHGLSEGKNQKGIYTNINKKSFKNIQTNMLKKCTYDTYFHTWDNQEKKHIIDTIKPKKYIFENAEQFKQSILIKLKGINDYLKTDISPLGSNIDYLYSLFSRFYSLYRSVQLIDKLENYDLIIISRFDLHLLKKLNIYKYNFNANTIYINNFAGHNLLNGSINATLDGVVNKYTQDILNYGFHDYFFFGNKDVITKFSKIYLFLEGYFSVKSNLYNSLWPRISGHSICAHHITNQNIKYKFTKFEERIYFCLIRDIQINGENNILKQSGELVIKKKFTKAIEILLNYQKDKPSANIYNEIAYIYLMKMSQLDKSLCAYKESLKIIPTKIAYESIIKIYIYQNNTIDVKKYCEECMRDFNSVYVKEVYNQFKQINM